MTDHSQDNAAARDAAALCVRYRRQLITPAEVQRVTVEPEASREELCDLSIDCHLHRVIVDLQSGVQTPTQPQGFSQA